MGKMELTIVNWLTSVTVARFKILCKYVTAKEGLILYNILRWKAYCVFHEERVRITSRELLHLVSSGLLLSLFRPLGSGRMKKT
jgi:hypothetical protein